MIKYVNAVSDADGWMSDYCCEWLFTQARKMSVIVEIGSWKGRSTHAICSGCDGLVYAVDTFRGSPNDEMQTPEIKGDEVYEAFVKNMAGFSNLIVKRTESIIAAAEFEDKSVDMVFIDGGHNYKDIRADIDAWLPKAKKLICGHDYFDRFPDVVRAVNETFNIVGVHDAIWYKDL